MCVYMYTDTKYVCKVDWIVKYVDYVPTAV